MAIVNPSDQTLLAIASKPVNSVADVIASFEGIGAALPDTDGIKWFNWLYLTVTQAVEKTIATKQWRNSQWLARLDVIFAGLYLDALRDFLTPGSSSAECWSVLFRSRNDARLARIQFAFAGMNAHIDHDLAIAVNRACAEFGIEPIHLSPEYLDYCQVNELLDGIVDLAKQQLMIGLLGDNLPCIHLVENMAAMWGLRGTREAAWANAELLHGANRIPGLGDRFLTGLDHAAALAGRGILAPVGI